MAIRNGLGVDSENGFFGATSELLSQDRIRCDVKNEAADVDVEPELERSQVE